jgi:cation diffusion facilitator CzcD-associated flavoprotein CzcO
MSIEREHIDIVVVGAGLSGVGAAYHIQTKCPDKSYAILEARETMGGTWDLFRYPGVRSDSDMYTLGYSFHPWTSDKIITDGQSILDYIHLTAEKFGIDKHIRYQHRVVGAEWSSDSGLWTIDVEAGDNSSQSSQTKQITCNFLYMCTGYYAYDYGYTPDWDTLDAFQGEVVHPQQWTEDIGYRDKRVIVIGSGATAVTIVPAMADEADHVTMLQRSPTYIVSRPAEDNIGKWLRRLLPNSVAHLFSRWIAILFQMYQFLLARRFPGRVKEAIMDMAQEELGDDYDVQTHFNPRYNPWDERLCLVPDSDFFNAINAGRASIVTDHIERFTENGILLQSGDELPADMIVTATGLRLKLLHNVDLIVDGEVIDMGQIFAYKGMMYCGVPNLAHSFGYTNASWTLKSELISEYVCRLMNHMDEHGYSKVVPTPPDYSVEQGKPAVDFTSGYIQRAVPEIPKQGLERPWLAHQNYVLDMMDIRFGKLADGVLTFHRTPGETVPSGSNSADKSEKVSV